jgi:hypothetical protein
MLCGLPAGNRSRAVILNDSFITHMRVACAGARRLRVALHNSTQLHNDCTCTALFCDCP